VKSLSVVSEVRWALFSFLLLVFLVLLYRLTGSSTTMVIFPYLLGFSVAYPDPGSGTFLTPGSGIWNGFFPDPGSRIPEPKPIYLRG
jgi:hypothetical protein